MKKNNMQSENEIKEEVGGKHVKNLHTFEKAYAIISNLLDLLEKALMETQVQVFSETKDEKDSNQKSAWEKEVPNTIDFTSLTNMCNRAAEHIEKNILGNESESKQKCLCKNKEDCKCAKDQNKTFFKDTIKRIDLTKNIIALLSKMCLIAKCLQILESQMKNVYYRPIKFGEETLEGHDFSASEISIIEDYITKIKEEKREKGEIVWEKEESLEEVEGVEDNEDLK